MNDNTMPERIIAGYGFHGYEWSLPDSVMAYRLESVTEYIRADVAAAQLAEREAKIIAYQTRVDELRQDLNMVIDQRNAALRNVTPALPNLKRNTSCTERRVWRIFLSNPTNTAPKSNG